MLYLVLLQAIAPDWHDWIVNVVGILIAAGVLGNIGMMFTLKVGLAQVKAELVYIRTEVAGVDTLKQRVSNLEKWIEVHDVRCRYVPTHAASD